MITTITLNPAIDIKYVVDNFKKDGVFRAKEVEKTAGGKGINVSRVIRTLGEPVTALGFLGGKNGELIEEEIESLEIENNFTKIKGITRNCIAILSNDNSQTEVLETGPEVSKEEIDNFLDKYDEVLEKTTTVCASGSICQNIEPTIYKDLIIKANEKGVKFLLDASGIPLKYGIEAAPFLIKPNKEELSILTDEKIETEKDIIRAIRDLMKFKIEAIVVSLGDNGAIAAYKDIIYRVNIPRVDAVNPVGSGDSMIGGFAVALDRGYCFKEMLKYGTACGIANAIEKKTGTIDLNNIKKFIKQISVDEFAL